jgi:peroxiredoxin
VEIKKTFEKKGLVVIGVAYDYDRKKVNDFVIRKGIDWIQVFQSRRTPRQNALIDKLKVFHYPTTFLIGKDGKILLRDRKLEEIENELRKLL